MQTNLSMLKEFWSCLFSSVVEHQSRKLGVVGSNPTGGKYIFIKEEVKQNIFAVGRVRTYAGRAH